MKYAFPILFMVACYSCQNKKEPISAAKLSELKIFVEQNFKESDSTTRLDSIRFLRYDTLTMADQIIERQNAIVSKIQSINEDIALLNKRIESNIRIAKLYAGLSTTLMDNYKNEAQDDLKESRKKLSEIDGLSRLHDSLKSLFYKTDTITPTHFFAVCLYQVRYKDQSVKKDTGYILLNKDLNIIKREDYKDFTKPLLN